MFNVTVLKMKDIKKYFIGMLATIIVVILASKYFPKNTSEKKIMPKVLSENSMLGCLEQTVPVMSSINEEYKKIESEDNEIKEENLLQGVLKTQISSIQGLKNIEERAQKEASEKEEQEVKQEEQQMVQKEKSETVEVAKTGLSTQVITNNPIKESYNTEYGKVKIKNETDYELTRRYVNTRYYDRK